MLQRLMNAANKLPGMHGAAIANVHPIGGGSSVLGSLCTSRNCVVRLTLKNVWTTYHDGCTSRRKHRTCFLPAQSSLSIAGTTYYICFRRLVSASPAPSVPDKVQMNVRKGSSVRVPTPDAEQSGIGWLLMCAGNTITSHVVKLVLKPTFGVSAAPPLPQGRTNCRSSWRAMRS